MQHHTLSQSDMVSRDKGRDKYKSLLASIDEQVEVDSFESLLQFKELRELSLS